MDTPSETASVGSPFDLQGLGKDQAELLDLIDSVQLAGIGDDIVPQIVVVGDQSSGKSSALTSLTGIEFPRQQHACTKHATEIRIRRGDGFNGLKVWIVPDKSVPRTDQELQALENFQQEINETPEMLLQSMNQASDLICPKHNQHLGTTDARPRFASKDKLIIEKSGPNLPALTLVDLPGLVRNVNQKQTQQDLQLIDDLTDMYMKDPATIILAVVSGAYEYVQSGILERVAKWDPEKTRTMGLVTKPDMADREHYTDSFVELMLRRDSNVEYHYKLGWHVLLNPDALSHPKMDERQVLEAQYWIGSKWEKLPDYMRGAPALRTRLNRLLQKEIARRLPSIQERIQAREARCKTDLAKLGAVLLAPEDKLKEIGRLFGLSHNLIQQAVHGTRINPRGEDFFPDEFSPQGIPARNLRAKVVEESNLFSDAFRDLGLRLTFTNKDGTVNLKAKREYAKTKVKPLLPQIRGRELPDAPNPRAPYHVFRSYARDLWPALAKEYEEKIEMACKGFLFELEEYAWPLRMRVPLEENYLREKCNGLWADARDELGRISSETFQVEIQPFDPAYLRCVGEARKAASSAKMAMSEELLVVEQMLAYYKLAEPIFIRNIIYQVSERHLLLGMMDIFGTTEMLGLKQETIDNITAEDAKAKHARKALKVELKRIQAAREKFETFAMRAGAQLDFETILDFDQDDDDDDNDNDHHGDMNGYARSENGDPGFNSNYDYAAAQYGEEGGVGEEETTMQRREDERKQEDERKRIKEEEEEQLRKEREEVRLAEERRRREEKEEEERKRDEEERQKQEERRKIERLASQRRAKEQREAEERQEEEKKRVEQRRLAAERFVQDHREAERKDREQQEHEERLASQRREAERQAQLQRQAELLERQRAAEIQRETPRTQGRTGPQQVEVQPGFDFTAQARPPPPPSWQPPPPLPPKTPSSQQGYRGQFNNLGYFPQDEEDVDEPFTRGSGITRQQQQAMMTGRPGSSRSVSNSNYQQSIPRTGSPVNGGSRARQAGHNDHKTQSGANKFAKWLGKD